MKSSLLRDTGIYTFYSILNKLIPFLLLPIITRYLPPEDYGIISMFSVTVTIVSPFIGLNVIGAVARQYYEKETIRFNEYVFNSIVILVGCTMLMSMVFLFMGKIINKITAIPTDKLWMVIIFAFCQFFINLLLTIWKMQKKAQAYGIYNISLTIFNIALSIIFVISLEWGWVGRIYGQLITLLIFAVMAIFFLMKKSLIKLKINTVYIKSALAFGIPLLPHALSGSIISITDRLFLTAMVGIADTGIYTVGYQIGLVINILAFSFNNAFVPWLFENLKKNDNQIKLKIVRYTYIYFGSIILLAISLGVFAPVFLSVFLGNAYSDSGIYIIWIALGYAFNGMYFMVVNYIFYAQKTKPLAVVTISAAALNVILNYIFIKMFGAIGAAQATMIVFACKFISVWFVSMKVYKMPWNLKIIKGFGEEEH